MYYDEIDEMILKIHEYDKYGIYVAGGASEEDITAIEKQLSVVFCEQYRVFLKRYGAFMGEQKCIAGILPGNPAECSEGTVLYHSKLFNEENFKLGNATVLDPGGEEFYRIIDHESSQLRTYDRFSKKLEIAKESIDEYIYKFVDSCLKLAKI